jgi:uncharacterized protein YxeA
MKTVIKIFCSIWLCSIVLSCAPLPNPVVKEEPKPIKPTCKILQIRISTLNVSFKYNKNNKIEAYTVNGTDYTVNYDADQNIEKISDSRGSYVCTFNYRNTMFPKLVTTARVVSQTTPSLTKTILLTYENNRDRVARFSISAIPSESYDFTYNDKGNISSYIYSYNFSPKNAVINTFDNAKNPYQLLPFPIYWSLFNNNLQTDILSYFSTNNLIKNGLLTINKYNSYSSSNYPISVTENGSIITTFFYEGCD